MAVAGLHNFLCYSHSSVREFRYGSSSSQDDEPKTPGSYLLQRRPEFVGDDIRSSGSGLNGSSYDGARYTSEDTDATGNQCAGSSVTEHEDNLSCSSEQSSDVGQIGKDRVRQVFQGRKKSGSIANPSDGCRRTSSQWHGENEGERVKITKEWVQISAQQRSESELVGDRDAETCLQIDQVRRNGMSAERSIRRICGRQTLSDLLQKAQQKRKVELMDLLEQKPVSGFAHRNRIQAFLRGRFLRNEMVVPEKKTPSVAVMELGMLKQRRTVSGLREEFLSRPESPLTLMNSSEPNSLCGDGNNSELESTCKELLPAGNHTTFDVDGSQTDSTVKPTDENNQVSSHHEEGKQCPSSIQQLTDVTSVHVENSPVLDVEEETELNALDETSGETEGMCCNGVGDHRTDEEVIMSEQCDLLCSSANLNELRSSEQLANKWSDNGDEMLELGGGWPSQDFQESIESWMSSPSMEIGDSSRTSSSVHVHVEDIDRYSELQELFSRKRVSTLVQSSFGERLDRILRSHVERQTFVSVDLEMENSSPSLTRIGELLPHFSNHQGCVVINKLRADMALLQEKMNDIQIMLEDCLDMQVELQRSIQQEASAAANRAAADRDESEQDQDSHWEFLRRGICCQCRNSSIDSLLYRCGHMCTCLRCAEELVRSSGKCPICRLRVLDTFQAK